MEGSYVVGTCESMCPKSEAKLREKENLLHKFEIKNGTESNRRPEYDPEKIIKCFSRSAAGAETTKPSNLRPFPVLVRTIKYLFSDIFPIHKEKPLVVYNFMFDRFRAVRQDAVIQNLPSLNVIEILEPIVRFLIYFSYILVEESIHEFDSHINNTHLQECMKRLLVCYDDLDDIPHANQWEIESAYLLFNLGNIKSLTRGVRLHKLHKNQNYLDSLELSFQWYLKNYNRVVHLMAKLPPLLLCVVNISLPEIRKYSLQAMSYAYSSPNSCYPVKHLREVLLLENDSQVVDECKHFNIKVSDGRVNFLKKDFDTSAKCRQGVRLKLIDEKLSECDLGRLLELGSYK